MMDLTQLANLGEFIGGVAVLVTLVYLAVQVKQTQEMAKIESARSSSKDWSELLLRLVDPDLMERDHDSFSWDSGVVGRGTRGFPG